MAIANVKSLLDAFLQATTGQEIRNVLHDAGDHPDLGLDVPFGDLGLRWHSFGDNPSNISTIGLGTKPGRSLTERLTNAMDALLEDRAQPNVTLPTSPRQAAKNWFSRPVSGPDEGLFKWDYSQYEIDKRISVVLLPSDKEDAPTIDVMDDGIGILPSDFASTILSLQNRNKINKWYVIGAFGQGGASTLAFSDYVLIISRHKKQPSICGFTLIRVLDLNETYKEDCYGYLAVTGVDGKPTVPAFDIGNAVLEPYAQAPGGDKFPRLATGTLVRHYSYKLTNLAGKLAPGTGNLYHYLHSSLFDPLFPFRLYDLRDNKHIRQELVRGSRNRLMRLQESEADGRTEIRHYRPMEYINPLGTEDASVGVEYWVVLNQRKVKDTYMLRAQSNELFVETGYPIIGTLNGQNQGQLSALLLRDIGLDMVARHIVIHLDATNANSRIRRELFATSREGFKDGPVLDDLKRILRKMLEEDDNLLTLERELTERIAKRETQSTSEEVRRQVTKLLVEAGLHLREEGPAFAEGGSEDKEPISRPKTRPYVNREPLPTLPFPQVTKFEIVSPRDRLKCHINDNELVLVETDADAEFDRRGLIGIRAEPPLLEQAAKAPLRGGRIRWRLRPKAEAQPGTSGKIIATITKPDGAHITATVDFEVLPPLEEKAKREKGFVPPFKILPINPYDNPEQWMQVWPSLDPAAETANLNSVAYKPVNIGGVIHVFYSTIFAPFQLQVEKLKQDNSTLSEPFRNNYEIWIGYHAILQERAKINGSEGIDPDALEILLENDRIRVAQMQVKQAEETAKLLHRAMRNAVAEEA